MWIFFADNVIFIVWFFPLLIILQKTKTRLITFFVTYTEYLLLAADLWHSAPGVSLVVCKEEEDKGNNVFLEGAINNFSSRSQHKVVS